MAIFMVFFVVISILKKHLIKTLKLCLRFILTSRRYAKLVLNYSSTLVNHGA